MHVYVAVTDMGWFGLHASKPRVEEVNFWRPSPEARKTRKSVASC
jgi:hypothetical protein